jgi:hypothetical protein
MKESPPVWCDWLARFARGGSLGIHINDVIGYYFQTLKGSLLELCPRGNNKDVIIIILVHDNVYIPC